jgi:DsbC/DsbD-like thiol-disulfide interchange protein
MHQDGPVTMALVLPDSGVLPNSTTWVGWWIEREDGWHTYWEHPGNVGLTPKLDWELPDGFKVESLQFPFPKRVQMAGVKAYGHHGKTLYLAHLQVPEIAVGESVKLTAKARWMVCSNVCLPQNTKLSITLPVVNSLQPDKQWEPRFSEFLDRLPKKIPENWSMKAREIGQFTKLTIANIDPSNVKDAYLFGGDYLVCSDANQPLRTLPSEIELLVPKPIWPKENPTHLNGLLQLNNSSKIPSFYTIQVPLN